MSVFRTSICTTITEREQFDSVFQQCILGDETGQYRQALDVAVEHDTMPSMTSTFVHGMMSSSTLIDGGDDFWGDVKAHKRMNWRSHMHRLRSEGYFHLMYHMTFLHLLSY
jgi:hypothetical protein